MSDLRFAQLPLDLLQVRHQTLILLVALFFAGRTKDSGRMNRRRDGRGPGVGRKFPVVLAEPISRTQQGLCRRCTQAHDDSRLDQRDLGLEPRTARVDLRCVRFLMDSAFAPFLEFEVFDDVGDVYGGSVDAGVAQGAIEQLASRTNKG